MSSSQRPITMYCTLCSALTEKVEYKSFLKMTISDVERLILAPGINPKLWKCNVSVQSVAYLVCVMNMAEPQHVLLLDMRNRLNKKIKNSDF